MNFFNPEYAIHKEDVGGSLSDVSNNDNGYVHVGEEWVENEAIEMLGLTLKGRAEHRCLFDSSLTWVRLSNAFCLSTLLILDI